MTNDGANVWIANAGSGTVSKVRVSDGIVIGAFPASGAANGIAFDGTKIWVSGFTFPGLVTRH